MFSTGGLPFATMVGELQVTVAPEYDTNSMFESIKGMSDQGLNNVNKQCGIRGRLQTAKLRPK